MSFVYLRWIGAKEVEPGLMEWLGTRLTRTFGAPVRALDRAPPPPDAFDPARGQFSSTRLLRWTLAHHPGDAWKVLSLTDGDLFIPVLTFVFGEAQVGGMAAVVSTARLRPEFYGLPPDPARLRGRLEKECIHELGHTVGLVHCRRPGCVMAASLTVLDVDAKGAALCAACRVRFRELSVSPPLPPGRGEEGRGT